MKPDSRLLIGLRMPETRTRSGPSGTWLVMPAISGSISASASSAATDPSASSSCSFTAVAASSSSPSMFPKMVSTIWSIWVRISVLTSVITSVRASRMSARRLVNWASRPSSALLTAATAPPARAPTLLGMPVRMVTVSRLPRSMAMLPFT